MIDHHFFIKVTSAIIGYSRVVCANPFMHSSQMSTMFLDSQTRLLTLIVVGCKRVCTRWSSLGDQLPKGLGAGAGWFSLIYRLVRLDPYFRKNWHCRCVFNCIVCIYIIYVYTYKQTYTYIHILLVYTISTVCICTYVYLVRVCVYVFGVSQCCSWPLGGIDLATWAHGFAASTGYWPSPAVKAHKGMPWSKLVS